MAHPSGGEAVLVIVLEKFAIEKNRVRGRLRERFFSEFLFGSGFASLGMGN